jgi:hypothetical protein
MFYLPLLGYANTPFAKAWLKIEYVETLCLARRAVHQFAARILCYEDEAFKNMWWAFRF